MEVRDLRVLQDPSVHQVAKGLETLVHANTNWSQKLYFPVEVMYMQAWLNPASA